MSFWRCFKNSDDEPAIPKVTLPHHFPHYLSSYFQTLLFWVCKCKHLLNDTPTSGYQYWFLCYKTFSQIVIGGFLQLHWRFSVFSFTVHICRQDITARIWKVLMFLVLEEMCWHPVLCYVVLSKKKKWQNKGCQHETFNKNLFFFLFFFPAACKAMNFSAPRSFVCSALIFAHKLNFTV